MTCINGAFVAVSCLPDIIIYLMLGDTPFLILSESSMQYYDFIYLKQLKLT